MGRADESRREFEARRLNSLHRRPAGATTSSSSSGFLTRLGRAAACLPGLAACALSLGLLVAAAPAGA